MKKILISWIVMSLIFIPTICLATSEESGELVEYIDSYGEYEDLISSMDDEYKTAYEKYLDTRVEEFGLYERPIPSRAKVIKSSAIQEYYGYYETAYKASYQDLQIEVLDGEFKGQTIDDFKYVLTTDSYDNIRLNEAKTGDVLIVYVFDTEEEGLVAYSLGTDSTVVRWPGVVTLLAVSIMFILIYLGSKGAKMIIPLILFFDLAFIVFVPLIFGGINILLLTALLVIFSAIVISLLKLGGKPSAWVAAICSVVMIFTMALLIYGVDQLTNMSAITFETTSMSGVFYDIITLFGTPVSATTLAELVPQGNIDFYALKVSFEIIMIFFATITIICKAIEIYEKNKTNEDKFKLVTNEMKEYSSDIMLIIMPILLTVTLPKYMLLFANKSTLMELINSQILLSDITRAIYILLAIALAGPLATFFAMISLDEKNDK